MELQRTNEWRRSRLGKFTGSQIYRLMVKGRSKDQVFGEAAYTYMKEVASERLLSRKIKTDDDFFNRYIEATDVTTKSMQYGIDNEWVAISNYEFETMNQVDAQPFIAYNEYFGDSPDGYIKNLNRAVEVKCLTADKMLDYQLNVTDADSFKAFDKKYYWQCVAHMIVLGAGSVEFMIYNEWMEKTLWYVTIERKEDDVKELLERVQQAEEIVKDMVNKCK
jgi:hypothetical protein